MGHPTLSHPMGHPTPTQAPLDEASFRRLSFLSTKMVLGLTHACGLHPRAHRAFRTNPTSSRELKNMVDADLLARFAQLGDLEQQRLALQIGSTPAKVHAALAAIAKSVP